MNPLKSIQWTGEQISKPGMYAGIHIDDYHDAEICVGPSISSSGLRKLNPDIGSPAHFYADWNGNPNRMQDDDRKRHFILGRALHHLLLGEPGFAKAFVEQPAEYPDGKTGELKSWNNNAGYCREWHVRQSKLNRTPLSQKEIFKLRNMAQSVGRHPMVTDFLTGLVERSFFWKDKETGIWLKWRPDVVPTHSADFADLKMTRSAMPSKIAYTIREYGYYQQAALGRDACRAVLGMDMKSFTYLFVENEPPWCTFDTTMPDDDLDRGARMNRACLRILAKCVRDNHWPGPGDGNEGTHRVGLSQDAREQIDKRLSHEGLADGRD